MSFSPIPPTPMAQHARARQQQGLNRVLGFVVFSVLLGPLAGLAGLVLYGLVRRSPRRMAILALGLLGGLVVAALAYRTMLAEVQAMASLMQPYREPLRALVRKPTAEHWQAFSPLFGAVWPLLRLLWQQLLPLAPLIALFLESTRTKTVEEQRAQKEQQTQARTREQHRLAAAKVAAAPEVVAGRAVIGVPITGDLGITAKGWAVYDADLLGRHAVVVGGSGTGKTEFILRIAYLARKVYGWKVFYLDAKGDPANAARFQAVMGQAQTEAAIFPDVGYDGWQGDATAILNRLMAVEDYSEPYYRAVAKTVLSLAVQAPEGPPRSSAALLERLQLDRLYQLYAGANGMQAEVLSSLNDESVNGVRRRYFGFFQSLDQKLDGAWSFDSVDAGYLLLDGLALKEEAISLGRYLLEDFAHYAAKRKPAAQRVLFIAEEFSAISAGGADAANLFERVRSYGAGMLVTSQSVEGLGADAARLFGAAAVTIAFQCADPELLAKRAGMRAEVQSSVQVSFPAIPGQNALARGRSQLLGTSTQHEREVLKLHPDTIRQLAIGECCFITNGSYQEIRVARIPESGKAHPPHILPSGAQEPRVAGDIPQAVPIERPRRGARAIVRPMRPSSHVEAEGTPKQPPVAPPVEVVARARVYGEPLSASPQAAAEAQHAPEEERDL